MTENPFIIYGYKSEELFCDRDKETNELYRSLVNGRNVTLIAQRRIGKSGLIDHLFHQKEVMKNYYTFHIDIYATKSLEEMILAIGKAVIEALKPRGKKLSSLIAGYFSSLQPGISFDEVGNPSFSLSMGQLQSPETTLEEIFKYLENADKKCIVAIDEFQTVATYPEKTTEALLRTYIQRCNNTSFIFSGSQRSMMAEMFLSASRPFYQSTTTMNIEAIEKSKYVDFAYKLFTKGGFKIDKSTIESVYDRFDGTTWYVQRVMNELYDLASISNSCSIEDVEKAINHILQLNDFNYRSLMFQLPAKQKRLFIAIAKAGQAKSIMSQDFIRRYQLPSASFVQAAIKGLLEKEFVTESLGTYEVYDKFFALWICKQY